MKKALLTTALTLATLLPTLSMAGEGHNMNTKAHEIALPANTYMGAGVIQKVNVDARTVNIAHEAIPTIKWPAMVMDIAVSDEINLDNIKAEDAIKFHLNLGTDKVYRIVKIIPTEKAISHIQPETETQDHSEHHNH